MTQTLVITSGKGGVGKTNISVNIALELARRNFRTCLLDADLGLANVNILLGINPEYTLDDYIFGDKNLTDIIYKTQFGIDVIPGSSGIEKMANLDRKKISGLVSSFSQIQGYDYFLIDTSSGISRGVIAFCLASTETILVITSEATSLTDAYSLLKVMALNHYTGTVKILVNKSPSVPQARETYRRFTEVANRHLAIEIAPVGIVLNDPNIENSVTRQEPILTLYPDSIASQCIKAMVANLLKYDTRESRGNDFSEFWQRYFNFSLLTLPESDKPADKMIRGNSLQPDIPESKIPQPPIAPLPVSNGDVPPSTDVQRPAEIPPKPFVACAHDGAICDALNLPSPLPLLLKALELQAQGQLTKKTLLTIISCNPILVVRALQMICDANTSIGQQTRVTTIHQLIQELGTEVLTNLLNTTVMQQALNRQDPPKTVCLVTNFWVHSYTCASIAENIAELINYPFPEEAFIAGLLHDIGGLALQLNHPEVYTQFADTFRHDNALLEMEQRVFAMTHAEVGAKALRSWHLDNFLVDAVQYHTKPLDKIETAFSLVKIVSMACRLIQSTREDEEAVKIGKKLFGLTSAELQGLVTKATEKSDQLAKLYNIKLTEEMEEGETEKMQSRFRKLAIDFALLQGVLPTTTCVRGLPEFIRTVFKSFVILFGFKPALCLMPDHDHSFLKVVEYPDCFGWGTLNDIQFSLMWEKSLVVKSFISGELKTAMEGENSGTLPLADRQLLRLFGSQGFVCLPMVAESINKGVIVFGITKTEIGKIHSLQTRLEHFGVQVAKSICLLEKPL